MFAHRSFMTVLLCLLLCAGCSPQKSESSDASIAGPLSIKHKQYPTVQEFESIRHGTSLYLYDKELVADANSIFLSPDKMKAIWVTTDANTIMLFNYENSSYREIGQNDAGIRDVIWEDDGGVLTYDNHIQQPFKFSGNNNQHKTIKKKPSN